MTFTEIVNSVADRLNLTSASSITRLGLHVNKRYKRLVKSMGLDTAVRGTATATTTIGNSYLVFASTSKILAVYDATVSPVRMLHERMVDEIRNQIVGPSPADLYAIYLMGANSVTLLLNSVPATAYTLTADVMAQTATLSGSQVPAFDEGFHDILEIGAMSDELMKMEKPDLAQAREMEFESRLSELRLFIAKSAYLDIYQGKTRHPRTWRTNVPTV